MANTTGKKYGGRKKNTPNKVTTDLRQFVTDLLNKNLEKLESDFEQLEPKERIKYTIDLLQYCLPKLKTTELEIEEKEKVRQVFQIGSQVIEF